MYVNSSSHQLCLLVCTPLSQSGVSRTPRQSGVRKGPEQPRQAEEGLGLSDTGDSVALAFGC